MEIELQVSDSNQFSFRMRMRILSVPTASSTTPIVLELAIASQGLACLSLWKHLRYAYYHGKTIFERADILSLRTWSYWSTTSLQIKENPWRPSPARAVNGQTHQQLVTTVDKSTAAI